MSNDSTPQIEVLTGKHQEGFLLINSTDFSPSRASDSQYFELTTDSVTLSKGFIDFLAERLRIGEEKKIAILSDLAYEHYLTLLALAKGKAIIQAEGRNNTLVLSMLDHIEPGDRLLYAIADLFLGE